MKEVIVISLAALLASPGIASAVPAPPVSTENVRNQELLGGDPELVSPEESSLHDPHESTQEILATDARARFRGAISRATTSGVDLTRTPLAEAQRALRRAGYDAPVTGMYDEETRDSIARFQRENGLEESGKPDPRTLAALGVPPFGESDPGLSAW